MFKIHFEAFLEIFIKNISLSNPKFSAKNQADPPMKTVKNQVTPPYENCEESSDPPRNPPTPSGDYCTVPKIAM